MDYKKKYEDALLAMKQRVESGVIDECYAEEIFPELRESEDERIRKNCIEYIKASCLDINELNECNAWIEKQGEQKPAEWSEEDKRKINRIYSILGQAADTHAFSTTCRLIGDKECIELQDFLKSIRPQSQWKPSDEQIEALDSATENCVYSEYQDCLRELIGQLKKLREE